MGSLIHTWKADEEIYALTVSPDGARVGAAVGQTIVIWDLHTRKAALGPLQGHTNRVVCVTFSSDGRTLASGSRDHTIRIWGTEMGDKPFGPLTGHTKSVSSVAFLPDGHLLISGSWDGTIRLWNALTGQPVHTPIATGTSVNSLAISPDGTRVYGALDDNTLRAYNVSTSALMFTCAGHENWVLSVTASPDGRFLASGSWDKTVRIWNAETGQAIGEPLQGHAGFVESVAFSPDGQYVVSGSDDATMQIWNANTGAMQNDPLRGHTACLWVAVFTPDGSHLISGSNDYTVRVWDVSSLMIQPSGQNDSAGLPAQLIAVEDEITDTTTLVEIIAHLGARGCANLTSQLDTTTCGNHPISSGGFGDIYKCKMENGANVAIKIMRLYAGSSEQSQKYLKYAAREVYAWSKCHHPNVQPLLGVIMFRKQLGMVANWESNGSLPQYLERDAAADRCALSTQIAEGLSYLHASGVVHGDLKGANVLIAQDGTPLLADFGNAMLQEYTLKFAKTSTKEAVSSRWAAPELFEGTTCSVPADVYALGMTILETITGDVPWTGKSERAIMLALMFHKTCPERPEEHIPTDCDHGDTLWSLLKSCWEIEPEKRPSAAEAKGIMSGITQGGLRRK